MEHLGLKTYKVCINEYPWLTLSNLLARQHLLFCAFSRPKYLYQVSVYTGSNFPTHEYWASVYHGPEIRVYHQLAGLGSCLFVFSSFFHAYTCKSRSRYMSILYLYCITCVYMPYLGMHYFCSNIDQVYSLKSPNWDNPTGTHILYFKHF